ncbi:MAG: hypothetical protein ABL953_14475 [Ilumatobacteraceae bacterium]
MDWRVLSRRSAFASHRLIGWIYWDPVAIANYAALGVPDGTGYYIATRGAPLAAAGDGVVTAAFGSIHAGFIKFSLDLCRQHTTFSAAAAARDAAVVQGLQTYVPELIEGLAELAAPLWAVADELPVGGRVLFAAHRDWPRPDDPLLSAWLAVNCIREWRGDTHWAMQIADGLSGTASGVLDGAWRSYDGDWLPRSRGADDAALSTAYAELKRRGLATDGAVNQRGIDHRQALEDQLDDLTITPWQLLGEPLTRRFLELIEPVGARLVERIDVTAGPNWMPAARDRPGAS